MGGEIGDEHHPRLGHQLVRKRRNGRSRDGIAPQGHDHEGARGVRPRQHTTQVTNDPPQVGVATRSGGWTADEPRPPVQERTTERPRAHHDGRTERGRHRAAPAHTVGEHLPEHDRRGQGGRPGGVLLVVVDEHPGGAGDRVGLLAGGVGEVEAEVVGVLHAGRGRAHGRDAGLDEVARLVLDDRTGLEHRGVDLLADIVQLVTDRGPPR